MMTLSVGKTRFELATPCTPYKCATGLRHFPNGSANLHFFLKKTRNFDQFISYDDSRPPSPDQRF